MEVIVVVGAGAIGQAIARRVSAGKKVLLADLRQENADAAAKTLSDAVGARDLVGLEHRGGAVCTHSRRPSVDLPSQPVHGGAKRCLLGLSHTALGIWPS
jgi:NAD(P)-dependent dehydrogenase (short-subunit alcohol dehydrogenase family)